MASNRSVNAIDTQKFSATMSESMTNALDFIKTATKEQGKLRLAVSGPSGSGKTFTSINVLQELGCSKVLVIDSEHGSAAKYSNEFKHKFKVLDNDFWKSNYDPRRLIAVLKEIAGTFDGVVVDSLTAFWMGPGGMLTLVDAAAKRGQARGGKYDSFGAWKEVDPIYNELIQTILATPYHFAACLRAKSEYEDQKGDNGKNKKVKVGMAAQMREGFEYEFDVEGMMTMNHEFVVGKTRCRALDELVIPKPGANMARPLKAWLSDGAVPSKLPEIYQPAAKAVEDLRVAVGAKEVSVTAAETVSVAETEPHIPVGAVSLVAELLTQIGASATLGDLKAVAEQIKKARTDNLITKDEYNVQLSPAYSEKNRTLKAAS